MFSLRFAESERDNSAKDGLFRRALGKMLGFVAGLVLLVSIDVIALDKAITRELIGSRAGIPGMTKQIIAVFRPR